jgi:hypothetical protein
MSRNRVLLIVALILFVLLVAARESGIINLNLYSSSISSQLSSHFTTSGNDLDQPLSFDITLTHDGRTWMEHRKAILGQPRVPITGELVTTFKGNTWLPLRKSFTMTYTCDFGTPPETSPSFDGEAKGTVTVKITGQCSRHEARQIAIDEAKKLIREYVLSMNP